ncbi:hypothetical protein OQA88_9674 [Cercophora sp. LCS_1]
MELAPRTRRTAQNTQHTYPIGRRVYDVKTYPVQSPQGATILLYGQENGVTIVWRGGRKLKPAKPPVSTRQNGSNPSDAVMIIDSDDEAPPAAPAAFVDKPEFEDAPSSSKSLPETVQTLDLSLGSTAVHLAVLPMAHCTPEDASWNGATILQHKIVFAVTCSTSDVFLVTLPLTPPSHDSKARPELRKSLLSGEAGKGVWGETVTLLGGQAKPGEGVAITVVKPASGGLRSRSVERKAAHTPTRAIVAVHSREASGALRFWDVSLDAKPGTIARTEPFQTEYLPAPLSSISFNPSHITQLLVVSPSQAVRVFDHSVSSLPLDETSEGFPTQGSWLLSLYAPFARGSAVSTARKPIAAAEWIANGHAVLALLADGQWGIWDIDGVSPTSNPGSGLFSKANSSLRGSAITTFGVTGHLEGTSPLRNPATQKTPAAPGSGDFVPMTPHTRRDAIATSLIGGSEKLATVKGGIDIVKHSISRGTGPGDESAILWLSGADPIVSVIPIISKFWDSQLRRAVGGGVNLWSGAQPTRMIRLTDLGTGLLGERANRAIGIPKLASASESNGSSSPKEIGVSSIDGFPIEVLLQGESRLVIVHESEEATPLTNRLLGARKKPHTQLKSTKAIMAYPQPAKPHSLAFNLSVAGNSGGLLRNRGPAKGLFESFDENMDVVPTTEAPNTATGPKSRTTGFLFANDLNHAADAPDDEAGAENRNVDQEIMDIMEIDRELEMMEVDRERGTKRVFFEED